MNKRTIILAFMGVLLIVTLSNTLKVASTGAPVGSTGAPGENTCGKTGCHTGNNNINTGQGLLSISIPEFAGNYIAGKTYTVTVTLQQQNIKRFGFALSAINKTISAGILVATDAQRTQILAGTNQFADREYITYKALGTNPYETNKGQWSFEWKAPDQYEGPVTFYFAAVSANNDGTDKGDEVYTESLVLDGFSSGIKQSEVNTKTTVYPNPVKNNFTISFENKESNHTKIFLSDIKGNYAGTLWAGNLAKGYQTLSFEKPAAITKGVYFIQIQQASKVLTHKIIFE